MNKELSQSLNLLPSKSKARYVLLILMQVVLGIIDLIGIALVSLLILSLSSDNLKLAEVGLLSKVNIYFKLENRSLEFLCVLGFIAFILKTLLTTILINSTFKFLSKSLAKTSTLTLWRLIHSSYQFISARKSQELANSMTSGAMAATTLLLGSFSVFIVESILVFSILTFLLLVNPVMTILLVLYFSIIGVVLQSKVGKWAAASGKKRLDATLDVSRLIQEMTFGYREIKTMGREKYFTNLANYHFTELAKNYSNELIAVQLPKIVFETAILVSSAVIAVSFSLFLDNQDSLSFFAIFLVSCFRILPSLLRINGQLLNMRSSITQSTYFHELLSDLEEFPISSTQESQLKFADDFSPFLRCKGVSFQHPDSSQALFENLTFEVAPGESLAILGESGSGKSTLLDLLLGFQKPTQGEIEISGLAPALAISRWPDSIAYVPQKIVLLNSTIRENILFGANDTVRNEDKIWDILELVDLAAIVQERGLGLDTPIGENGLQLSGGQQQRLGIARALVNRPKFLILDESTSALDDRTDAKIMESVLSMPNVTKIVISHRKSITNLVDKILQVPLFESKPYALYMRNNPHK
jgi:ABC-type multidrug transport system fused ATPase/permease subunit